MTQISTVAPNAIAPPPDQAPCQRTHQAPVERGHRPCSPQPHAGRVPNVSPPETNHFRDHSSASIVPVTSAASSACLGE
jgi:hypothetical protein